MCGIIGYVGPRSAPPILLDGLRALEYRGYDSAGVVTRHDGDLEVVRAPGKLDRLVEALEESPVAGSCGLGHTRWATHGAPNHANAHPHRDARGRLAVIHNGIIENFLPLKRRLTEEGWEFSSETDTEVIANLISARLEDTDGDLPAAVAAAVRELEGMYAFAVVAAAGEPLLVAARSGPPLVLGLGDGEQFLASDPAALLAHTKDVVFLENGDLAVLTADGVSVTGADGEPVERRPQRLDWDPIQTEKGGYKHFMLKEIHEQPQAIQDTFAGRVDFENRRLLLEELAPGLRELDLGSVERIQILACGTSWHAGLLGRYLIETLARVPVEVDYGSEFRYRDPLVGSSVLALGISQSGETADTLAAMEEASRRGARLLAICNVPGSQITRISDASLYTQAGPEIGVASTKAFTTQLVALYLLALHLRQARGLEIDEGGHLGPLAHLPAAVDQVLAGEEHLRQVAHRYARAENVLYLGRGLDWPIALEGALKLKEISYIHAEGYPAGEMKHGPIALIDEDVPVVAIAAGDGVVFDKMKSNMQEVKARGGRVLAVTDRDADELDGVADEILPVPTTVSVLQPVINVVPLQLLAYHIGVRRGADVDQPRNLAKSVTVE